VEWLQHKYTHRLLTLQMLLTWNWTLFTNPNLITIFKTAHNPSLCWPELFSPHFFTMFCPYPKVIYPFHISSVFIVSRQDLFTWLENQF
jgi:hypothetical protein